MTPYLHALRQRLAAFQNPNAAPEQEALQILQHVLGLTPAQIYLESNGTLSPPAESRVEAILLRRKAGEPLQYILGKAHFWDMELQVGPGVLIPRPETEQLLQIALAKLPPGKLRIAELGAGSGNIGLALLRQRPLWEWYAYELSLESFQYAHRNRQALSLEDRYDLTLGDFFKLAPQKAPYDWILSNPPYVATSELLPIEVQHEPPLALFAGPEGKACLERLLTETAALLNPGGGVLFEIGARQGDWIRNRMRQEGWVDVEVLPDLSGKDRIAFAKRS